jgi:hypothetical protein
MIVKMDSPRVQPAARRKLLSPSTKAESHIVVGFNDTREFNNTPVSLSGFMYSDDGGVTFVDGGQLPTPGDQTVGGDGD